ncbi:MAG: hypothetical protein HKN28_10250 [Alphaproteobacteria bacterium]|nr:hypothetical protein [Alphaproteobacteria bacterium]
MKTFTSLSRRVLANRLCKTLFVLAVVYGVYIVYVGANFMLVPHGLEDPVYRLTGIPRTDQIIGVSVSFVVIVLVSLIWHLARDGRPLDYSSSVAAKRGTTLLLALIFLNGGVASLAAVLDELSSQFWLPLFGWVALVLALQVLVVYAGLLRIKQAWVLTTLLGVLSTFNLFALYLSLLGAFQSRSDPIQIAIVIVALLSFVVVFATAGKSIVPLRGANAVLALMMIGPVATLALAPSAAPDTATRLAPFGKIEFRTKPNVHIVSFDALSASSLAEKYMGLADLAYEDLLENESVVVFKNAFASHVPTRPSLNSLMRLAHPDFDGDFGYFAGRSDGPVAHVFRVNGYKISTGFDQQYFGGPGPFVDAYIPEPARTVRNSTLCALASDDALKFFGFCTFGTLFDGPAPEGKWPDRVNDIVGLSSGSPDTKPAFTLHYIVNPIGHTALDYRSSDKKALERYAGLYHNKAAELTAIMEQLIETVRENPAPSILIVMGDHGPFLSRTASFDDDPTFIVEDQHGILAVVLANTSGCTPQQLRHYTAAFATPERILAGVMRCLASDPERFDAALNFDEAFDFTRYLYE